MENKWETFISNLNRKSKLIYTSTINKLEFWFQEMKLENIEEEVIVQYILKHKNIYCYSTLKYHISIIISFWKINYDFFFL